MLVLGLDIGTTTVSAVVTDEKGVLAAKTLKNDALLTGLPFWAHAQNPRRILELARNAADGLLAAYPAVERIGVTGQQHGIVYLDGSGEPISPLYTWQDGRGDLPYADGQSYAARLTALTGLRVATGFGMVTHFYNLQNALVPKNARTLCTVADYVAMALSGRTTPYIEASNAASLGLFDLSANRFDAVLEKAGIDPAILPALAENPCLGGEIPVYVAIGDNQASFLGATCGKRGAMLVNIGTGSQFSVHVDRYTCCEGLDTRPLPTGGCLLVGSSLCGGRAYALLERFFRMTAELITGEPCGDCYDALSRAMESQPDPADRPIVSPLFQGTRKNPALRGAITNLDTKNFEPVSLLYAMLHGMTDELHSMYLRCREVCAANGTLFGSGNGLRRNPRLQEIVSQTFGMPLVLSANQEEAACGAAYFARQCG